MDFVLSPRKLALVLALVISFLTLAHFATQLVKYLTGHDTQLGLVRLFNQDEENNIPAWYASSTLLLCSILLAVIGLAKKQMGLPYARHWLVLAAIFLYLSLDEAASIHEMTLLPLHYALNTTGYLYFAWVVPGGMFVLVVLLAYLPFLATLPVKTRYLFLISGALYVGGALGIEAIGGNYVYLYGPGNLTYSMLVGVEEGLEMIGVASFIYSLLSYLASDLNEIRILVTSGKPKEDNS
jgi:hypothetical protein